MPQPPDRAACIALDATDPLARCRDGVVLPEGVLYLDGNSLGPLTRAARAGIERTVAAEWGQGLIRSWNDADWIDAPRRIGARIAPLLGVGPDEVIVCDSTSLNLFKLVHGALALRPGRRVVLTDAEDFPTDRYLVQRVAVDAGASVATGSVEQVLDRLSGPGADDVAVVALSHVDYRTGRRHDIAAITRAASRCGALVVWDLAHSAGAMALDLAAAGVELAVGCGYKYLNGGPGAPAFAYVARALQPLIDQPLPGWMGHEEPFAFAVDYRPAPDLRRLLVGTPPIVAMAALDGALELFEGVDPAALRSKSVALTSLFVDLVDHGLSDAPPAGGPADLVTPRNPTERGSHLTYRHPHAHEVVAALIERGVIGDFRAPDLARFGFAPLYIRHVDVWDAAQAFLDVLQSGEWDRQRFRTRRTVT